MGNNINEDLQKGLIHLMVIVHLSHSHTSRAAEGLFFSYCSTSTSEVRKQW